MDRLPLLLLCLQVQGPDTGSCASDLDPAGRHVCRSSSQPPVLTCCSGWKQAGRECPTALCEGDDACHRDEVCVRPGICRCKPGFFGASCAARCPGQFWGPDCKESCLCYPNGTCDPATGDCSCHPGRWGPLCQFACPCSPRSHCDPLTGACRCRPGWWGPDCRRPCVCNQAGSRCDPVTGRCLCHRGWWGRRCTFFCSCNGSPCAQETGQCECRAGLWGAACQHPCQCLHGTCAPQDGRCACNAGYQGPSCADPCPAGRYGLQCTHRCDHCKDPPSCSPVNGSCPECDPGWRGTHCQQICPPGRHGENCSQSCPRCFQAEPCHPETGECQHCEVGLQGARCEAPCPVGLFGAGCRFRCPDCFNGSCDPVSGTCVCQAGHWGASCNWTCPDGFHGPNCSESCQCVGGACHPISGDCQGRGQLQGVLLAGILAPLLVLLLLCICCCVCCCCYRPAPMDTGSRASVVQGDPVARVKRHMLGTLANLSSASPCFSLGRYRVPGVTVSHHDTEIPFNPSFIEPPSTAWPSDSSFDTDEDEEGGLACPLPASEAADLEHQTGFLPEAWPSNPEPFSIPRTSSVAKAKRPSVSFAEGTRFGPQSPKDSTETLSAPMRKPKAPWGLSEGTSPQPLVTGPEQEPPQLPHDAVGSCYENVEAGSRLDGSPRGPPRNTPAGRRKCIAGSRLVAQRVEALEAATKAQGHEPSGVTTIYVAVGKVGGGGEGPVQALLQRLGSLRRAKPVSKEEPQLRGTPEDLQKTPRGAPDSRRLLVPGKAGLGPLPDMAEAEAQGLLGGLLAPAGEETGECGGPEPSLSLSQPEALTRGLDPEEGREPKYENVCGWSGSP